MAAGARLTGLFGGGPFVLISAVEWGRQRLVGE